MLIYDQLLCRHLCADFLGWQLLDDGMREQLETALIMTLLGLLDKQSTDYCQVESSSGCQLG